MTTRSLNGNGLDLHAKHGTSHRQYSTAYLPHTNGDGRVERTAATPRQQLEAAQRQIDALVKLNMLLKEKSALLAESLANAQLFAFHDELTGLPNRRLLHDRFSKAVARASRQNSQVAVLFVDLDDFKCVNDTFGHLIADRLLQQVAARLKACIRCTDTACRYGGDELVILLPDIDTQVQGIDATRKIRTHLAAPYDVDGMRIEMTASIGMATWPTDGKDCVSLIKAADVAMYREKATTLVQSDGTLATTG